MYCERKVTDDIIWVGADDHRLAMFEGVYSVPRGVSYNSYLVLDEKTVLFDTVDKAVMGVYFENVEHGLGGRKLDYLVVQHMEPDHTAALAAMLDKYPEATVVCSRLSLGLIKQFTGIDVTSRAMPVGEGDRLCSGRHSFVFVTAPMVHWPEVIVTYDETEKILFSADAFGTFGALSGALFADEVDFYGDYLDEARRYYCNIVGKYGPQVQALLAKAKKLDIRMICSLHGHVHRDDLCRIIEKYDLWSRYEPEDAGVMIAYASVYGHTENAAELLACRLKEKGIKTAMYDVSVAPASEIIAAAFRFSHLVFASTTYNAGIFVSMDELLRDIVAHNLQGRRISLIQNGSWAPASGRLMRELLEPLPGTEFVGDTVTLKSALAPGQEAEIEKLACEIAASVDFAKKESAPAEAPKKRRFVCRICGYVYEGDSLPADFVCPLCRHGAEFFDEVKD